MFLGMGAEFIQLVLQFGDRLFKFELMLHAPGMLMLLPGVAMWNYARKTKGPDFRPAPW
jgi:hypothetical protein